jgi:hypothetical protein
MLFFLNAVPDRVRPFVPRLQFQQSQQFGLQVVVHSLVQGRLHSAAQLGDLANPLGDELCQPLHVGPAGVFGDFPQAAVGLDELAGGEMLLRVGEQLAIAKRGQLPGLIRREDFRLDVARRGVGGLIGRLLVGHCGLIGQAFHPDRRASSCGIS